jgi:hypothetical protein
VKPLLIWLAIVAVVFGVFALVSTALQETSRVFVFVDASFPMDGKDDDIRAELDGSTTATTPSSPWPRARRNDSELVHSWQPELRGRHEPLFAPCSFAEIDSFPEAADADDRILVTTSDSCDTSALVDWEIVLLD